MRRKFMELEKLISDLQGNPNLIADFILDPEATVDRYDLSAHQRKAILSGDLDSLVSIGISNNLAVGVMSGAHTPYCRPVRTRP
ncbi:MULTISPECIES: arginine deiminase [unclassified Granulicatella]|uniref:arginine deiminase n=1 Tax=unclassified Granulicatella TaxID=2630493 RepID=UPI001073E0C4|nr:MULTISPECIES: arginine deiminase [unclassified Granulicatella]MBF0780642.1 arginine deiminase [Granulicatella sp. 19428wC4_WM01]TFU94571.1 arginine deiminase [Granulicatella sp. WM01]